MLLYSLQVPDTEDENGNGDPAYKEFSKLLLDGQAKADLEKKCYFFTWRGYRACIASQIPKLTHHELKRRFQLAMQHITKKEDDDGEIFFYPSQNASIPNKPTLPPTKESYTSSGSQNSSSSSFRGTSDSLSSEPTQIPETQFQMQGAYTLLIFFLLL